jgi:hypothetical protein
MRLDGRGQHMLQKHLNPVNEWVRAEENLLTFNVLQPQPTKIPPVFSDWLGDAKHGSSASEHNSELQIAQEFLQPFARNSQTPKMIVLKLSTMLRNEC